MWPEAKCGNRGQRTRLQRRLWDNKKRKWLALIRVRFLVVGVDRDFSLRMAAARRLVLRDAAAGLYAQMYYWGQDVQHAEGNLLVRYGMTRVPKETPKGTSRYRQYWGGGWIELHGFCAGWYGPERGVVFDRARDRWLNWNQEQPPEPTSLGVSSGDGLTDDLLEKAVLLMEWAREYETWAQGWWGAAGRRSHHRAFLKLRPRRWWLPPDLALSWFRQWVEDPLQAPRPRKFLAAMENHRDKNAISLHLVRDG